jgi:copper chaperone CopZ
MKKFGLFIWLFTLLLTACQTGSTADNKEITDEDIARTVDATHVAEIEVTGMTCEMGCGGDIRKALRHTGGVSKVDFDFENDREVNVARVYFDNITIQPDELRKVIVGLNKGQFTVGQIQTSAVSSGDVTKENKKNNDSGSGVQMNNQMFSITDALGVVASWFL